MENTIPKMAVESLSTEMVCGEKENGYIVLRVRQFDRPDYTGGWIININKKYYWFGNPVDAIAWAMYEDVDDS